MHRQSHISKRSLNHDCKRNMAGNNTNFPLEHHGDAFHTSRSNCTLNTQCTFLVQLWIHSVLFLVHSGSKNPNYSQQHTCTQCICILGKLPVSTQHRVQTPLTEKTEHYQQEIHIRKSITRIGHQGSSSLGKTNTETINRWNEGHP